MGYTEHGLRHAKLVSNIAQNILPRLGFSERQTELAAIAGYLHDIGNIAKRKDHGRSGAVMVLNQRRAMLLSDIPVSNRS